MVVMKCPCTVASQLAATGGKSRPRGRRGRAGNRLHLERPTAWRGGQPQRPGEVVQAWVEPGFDPQVEGMRRFTPDMEQAGRPGKARDRRRLACPGGLQVEVPDIELASQARHLQVHPRRRRLRTRLDDGSELGEPAPAILASRREVHLREACAPRHAGRVSGDTRRERDAPGLTLAIALHQVARHQARGIEPPSLRHSRRGRPSVCTASPSENAAAASRRQSSQARPSARAHRGSPGAAGRRGEGSEAGESRSGATAALHGPERLARGGASHAPGPARRQPAVRRPCAMGRVARSREAGWRGRRGGRDRGCRRGGRGGHGDRVRGAGGDGVGLGDGGGHERDEGRARCMAHGRPLPRWRFQAREAARQTVCGQDGHR